MSLKLFLFWFFRLAILCLISLWIALGYDEGTLSIKFIGELFTSILLAFKFPFGNLLYNNLLLGLTIDVVIYSIVFSIAQRLLFYLKISLNRFLAKSISKND